MQKQKENITISDSFIDKICKKLTDNESIRRSLPLNGRLSIERSLPFICVYRSPAKGTDKGTEKLVKGEASYLIASSSSKLFPSLSLLLQNIITLMSSEHKAFLIIEIWTKKNIHEDSNNGLGISNPHIKIKISKDRFNTETVESIEKALEIIYVQKQKVRADVVFDKKQWPEKMSPLISSTFAKSMNCFFLGIEVEPFYNNSLTGELYPLVLRKLHQGLSRAIKLGVYQFSHHQTSLRPTNYQSLGRRAMVKAVWEVDQKLAEISNAYDFLLLVTPINIDQSWNKFKKNKFEKEPVFHYRPIPINPSSLKTKLYEIPIEQIEDPTLSNLFYEKQFEIEKSLSMLRDRRTRNFYYGSMQLYGEISEELKKIARDILENTSSHSRNFSGTTYYNADDFARRAEEEIKYYKQYFPEMHSKVIIREDITGLMVSRGNLFLGKKIRISAQRVEALLQHEIGTHIVTYINGKAQPFQLLYTGLAGYEELQEGLAVLTEYLVDGLSTSRLRLLAGRVIAVHNLINGASFIETFRDLNKKFDFNQRIAYIVTARVYRGGGLTKDAVYLRGVMNILKYFSSGGELESLLVGKISANHLPIIKELQARKIIKPLMLRPRYLDNLKTTNKMSELKNGLSVLNLIKRR